MNFAGQGHLGDETDLLIGMDCYWRFRQERFNRYMNFVIWLCLNQIFGWILRGSLNADGTENHVINTNFTHVLRVFAMDRYNYKNDVYIFSN